MVAKKAVCTFDCLFVRSFQHFCIHGVQRAKEEKGTCVHPKNFTLSVNASEVYLNLPATSFRKKYSNTWLDPALPLLMKVTEGTTYCMRSNNRSHLLSMMEKGKKKR